MKAAYILSLAGVGALAAAFFLDVPQAVAFPFESSWHLPADGVAGTNRAGAGGIYGVGSPSEFGIRCDHCHIDPTAEFQVQVTANPPFLVDGNDRLYEPGQPYNIEIRMLGETRFNGALPQLNGFAGAFEAADGTAVGVLVADNGRSDNCPQNAPAGVPMGPSNRTIVYGDCHGVIYEPEPGDTFWVFQWIAPAAGAGDVTFWYGVTDGNTGGDSSLEDDTVQGKIDLIEM